MAITHKIEISNDNKAKIEGILDHTIDSFNEKISPKIVRLSALLASSILLFLILIVMVLILAFKHKKLA